MIYMVEKFTVLQEFGDSHCLVKHSIGMACSVGGVYCYSYQTGHVSLNL